MKRKGIINYKSIYNKIYIYIYIYNIVKQRKTLYNNFLNFVLDFLGGVMLWISKINLNLKVKKKF